MKRTITILLLASMLLSAASCGSTDSGTPSDTTVGDTTPAVTTAADPYDYPDIDLEGATFTFLMPAADMWNMHCTMDLEAQTGEPLDDVIYNRNRAIEDKYNFKIESVAAEAGDYYKIGDMLRTDVMAGDNTYDAAYMCGTYVGSLVTEGLLMDLSSLNGLNLDGAWWNQVTIDASYIGDEVYFAQGDLSVSAFDLTWCLFFNEDMMDELKLDKPYDLVREGKWTIDRLAEYCKAAANLNGDASFTITEGGNARYGYTTYYNGAIATMVGAGVRFTEQDKNGNPALSLDNEHFYNVCDRLATLYGAEGDFIEGTTGGKATFDGYAGIFYGGRSLFYGGEMKSAGVFRDFNATFGVVPNPKYEESQEGYYSLTNQLSPVLVVPKTTKDPETAGVILDTLAYMSSRDVLPIYYDVTMAQKGLRNEDSIEMMDIIRSSLFFDASMAYGWTTNLADTICHKLVKGEGDMASTIASASTSVNTKITQMLEKLAEN